MQYSKKYQLQQIKSHIKAQIVSLSYDLQPTNKKRNGKIETQTNFI